MSLFQPSVDMTLPSGISIACGLPSFITLKITYSHSRLWKNNLGTLCLFQGVTGWPLTEYWWAMTVMRGPLSEMNLEMWWVSQNRCFMETSRGGKARGCPHGVFVCQINQYKTTKQRLSAIPLVLRANLVTQRGTQNILYDKSIRVCLWMWTPPWQWSCLWWDSFLVAWPVQVLVSVCWSLGTSPAHEVPRREGLELWLLCPFLRSMGGILLFEEQLWSEPPSTWGRTRWLHLFLLPKVLKDLLQNWSCHFRMFGLHRFLKETVRKRSQFSICCRCHWLHVISV